MSKISEISNNAFPVARKTNPSAESTDGFSDIFSEALTKTEDSGTPTIMNTDSVFVDTTEDILAKTIEDSLANNMLAMTTSSDSAAAMSPGYGVESMLLASAATGEIDDNQIAIFMLYMMMNASSSDSSDASMLYGVMSALLTSMTSASAITTDAVGDAPGTTIPIVVGWDTSSVVDGSENNEITAQPPYSGPIKSAAIPDASEDGSAILPIAYWTPATPAIVGSEADRSAENLRAIIDQFNVETAGRYAPRDGYTYCNIFLWDVTSALGCEIPHYVNPDTGEPMTYPDVSGSMELNSNRTLDWLISKGGEYGWREVTAEEAQNAANQGLPAVTIWKNPGSVGHVQVVCPSEDGLYNAEKGPTISQAGRKTLNYAYARSVYSVNGMSKLRYFVHD